MTKWARISLLLALLSCDDFNDCDITDYSESLVMSFRNYETQAERTVIFDQIIATYSDEISISVSAETTTTDVLPIDLSGTYTSYQFVTDSATYDFAFSYVTEAIIENPECGPVFRIKGLEYDAEATNFDSVAFQVLELTNYLAPHVEVYF